jgi:hypothetical protein
MNNFEEALNLVDDQICNEDASLNRALIAECVGESYYVQDCFYRLLMASPSTLSNAHFSFQKAVIEYLGTDVKASEILSQQHYDDRFEKRAA